MNRRLYDDGGIVANTILQQLGGAGRLRVMTSAYNFRDLGNGLSFKIKNQRANYIKINLTSMDLYDVEVGRIRGNTYKVVQEADGLYFDQLKPFIEKATGMYLSLADGGMMSKGGMIEHKTEDGETLKYKIDTDEMSIEVDFPTMEYLSENGIVMKREARQLNDKYIFWYDKISDTDREQLEEVLDVELPVYNYDDDDEYAKGGELISDDDDDEDDDDDDDDDEYAIQSGQSFDWLKDGVEHTISVTEVKDGMVFYRLDGRSKVLEIEDFEDFLEDNNLKAGQKFSVGGMTAGRWYKDNTGAEFRFIGKKDSGINEGKLVFNDGTGNVYKTLDDFASLPKQNKLFGFFEDGGNIEQGNLDMVKNQVVQVEHHAKELMQTLKSNPQVDAWVVAKMDRATSNLSDITHYLEGEENSFAKGGKVKKKRVRFVDKVESIADRLDGTKVPKNLKKDYGGRYNREEAEEAGRRIAGAQLRDRKMMAKGGDVDNKFYIEYLNKKKGFKRDKKFFETYEKAIQWAKDNFENFSPDMIKRN